MRETTAGRPLSRSARRTHPIDTVDLACRNHDICMLDSGGKAERSLPSRSDYQQGEDLGPQQCLPDEADE